MSLATNEVPCSSRPMERVTPMEESPMPAGRGADTPTTVSDEVMHDEEPAVNSAEMSTRNTPSRQATDQGRDSSLTSTSRPPDGSVEGTKTRSSRYRGVCWNKKNKRWQAAINNGGRYIYLGSFTSDIDAARAFDLAALQIRGRNTKLNFSVDDYPEDQWASGAPPHLIEKYMSGTPRPKAPPFRQFSGGTPMKKLQPSHFATIHVPVKRRFEESIGKKAFDRAEQRFLSGAFFPSTPVTPQPKIKQEFPQVPLTVEPSFTTVNTVEPPFEKAPLVFLSPGLPSNDIQSSRTIKTPSITTPSFGMGRKDPLEQATEYSKHELPRRTIAPDPMDCSAERKLGYSPVPARQPPPQSCPVPLTSDPRPVSDQFPVPIVQSSQDEHFVHVSSIVSETLAGSNFEEAKVIVGSSRNQFGLSHRMVNNAKWNALVWDGTTMHNMGVYASEEDAQVACSSAVRLVETIMTRNA